MVRREELAQELARNGVEPPAKFVQNDPVQLEEVVKGCLPHVDISLLTSPCVSIARAEAIKLHQAFSTFGCCLAVNHGMSREFMDTVRGVCHDFFRLLPEEKSKYARPDDTWQGYGFDKRSDDYGTQDWTDRLMFKLGPEAQRNFKYWPKESPSNFREVMKECNKKVDKLLEDVLNGMARSLELEEEKSFLDEIGEPRWIARLSLYPKCSRAHRVLGLDAHTDGTVLTFVLLDREVGGAQIFVDGRWVEIPFRSDDAILMNLGDQGEIITNGEFKAPLHRVAVNAEKERKSVAFFCLSEKDKVVGPVKGIVNGTTKPPKYKKVTNYELTHVRNPKLRALVDSMKL